MLGRRWLVQQLDVPFVADESVVTPADVTWEVLGGSATAVSIKTARSGFTGSQRTLHLCRMDVALPPDLDPDVRADTLARERAYSHELQRAGEWLTIRRCVGQYSNLSIFDAADNDRLLEILWNLPLFAFMTIEVTPLARHPSDLAAG